MLKLTALCVLVLLLVSVTSIFCTAGTIHALGFNAKPRNELSFQDLQTPVEKSYTLRRSTFLELLKNKSIIKGGGFDYYADLAYWVITTSNGAKFDVKIVDIDSLPESLGRAENIVYESSLQITVYEPTLLDIYQNVTDSSIIEAIKGKRIIFNYYIASDKPVDAYTYLDIEVREEPQNDNDDGGGCPVLYVYKGGRWVFENNLLPTGFRGDEWDLYILQTDPIDKHMLNKFIELKINETGDTSYLDYVALYMIVHRKEYTPIVDVVHKKLLLVYLNDNAVIKPKLAIDMFGNNLTYVLSYRDDIPCYINPNTWIELYFELPKHIEKPLLVLRSDPIWPPRLKYSLMIQVYHNGKWHNITILEPRYRFYLDAIPIPTKFVKGVDVLRIRILSTALHRLDWAVLVPRELYRHGEYMIFRIPLWSAKLVDGDESINVRKLILFKDHRYVVVNGSKQLLLKFWIEPLTPIIRIANKLGLKTHYLLKIYGHYVRSYRNIIRIEGPKYKVVPHSLHWDLISADYTIPKSNIVRVSFHILVYVREAPVNIYIDSAEVWVNLLILSNYGGMNPDEPFNFYTLKLKTNAVVSFVYFRADAELRNYVIILSVLSERKAQLCFSKLQTEECENKGLRSHIIRFATNATATIVSHAGISSVVYFNNLNYTDISAQEYVEMQRLKSIAQLLLLGVSVTVTALSPSRAVGIIGATTLGGLSTVIDVLIRAIPPTDSSSYSLDDEGYKLVLYKKDLAIGTVEMSNVWYSVLKYEIAWSVSYKTTNPVMYIYFNYNDDPDFIRVILQITD